MKLILTWSLTCAIINSTGAGAFEITDTKFYFPVITLSTQDNSKLLQQLKSGFKIVNNWNKYLSKPELLAQNPNLNYLVEPSFQGVNRLFVVAFENDTQRTSRTGPYPANIQLKKYNIMINSENFFDKPVQNDQIATGHGDDYTNGCLLDYPYFKDSYKMVAADLSKQQALDADPRTIQ